MIEVGKLQYPDAATARADGWRLGNCGVARRAEPCPRGHRRNRALAIRQGRRTEAVQNVRKGRFLERKRAGTTRPYRKPGRTRQNAKERERTGNGTGNDKVCQCSRVLQDGERFPTAAGTAAVLV